MNGNGSNVNINKLLFEQNYRITQSQYGNCLYRQGPSHDHLTIDKKKKRNFNGIMTPYRHHHPLQHHHPWQRQLPLRLHHYQVQVQVQVLRLFSLVVFLVLDHRLRALRRELLVCLVASLSSLHQVSLVALPALLALWLLLAVLLRQLFDRD